MVVALGSCFNIEQGLRGAKKHGTPPYSMERSRYLIDLAAIVGCSAKAVEDWSCKLCQKHKNIVNVTRLHNSLASVVGYIGYDSDNNDIILSWRGSADTRNWIEDFTFNTVAYPGCEKCEIHDGFYADYRLVEKQVNEAVDNLIKMYPTSRIVATGHSLGGALAEVCGLELAKKYGDRVKEVHHFGGPRIGNYELAMHTHKVLPVIFRVVHNRDLVPHLPPE